MIIITGGAGFIGSNIVAKLNQAGIKDITIVDNLRSEDKWKNLIGKSFRAFIHRDQFLEKLQNGQVASKIDAIVHMGACSFTTEKNADYLLANNVDYSMSLAKYSAEKGCRFIYASSGATYGNGELGYSDDIAQISKLRPTNPYGFSKYFFDLWMLEEKLLESAVGLKFFNVYGPNEYHKKNQASLVPRAYVQAKKQNEIELFKSLNPNFGDGEQKRDFVYVKDCADVVHWLLENKNIAGLFNLGTGKARTWRELAESVFAALNIEGEIEYIDLPENLIGHYQYFTEAKMEKLKAAGYQKPFTSLEDGIKDYITRYLENSDPYV